MSIKILDTFEPAGEFELVDALHVGFDEDSNVDIELRNLNTKINDFTRLFNGIPTFRLSDVPEANETLELGAEFTVGLFVESVNAAECRILVRRQKVGTNSVQTFNAVCYPGQNYPLALTVPKEIGVYAYTISVTNGTKRCGLEGTTDGTEADIQYEFTFNITCGTATLALPTFTLNNARTIYSYTSNDVLPSILNLDVKYTVAQAIRGYIIEADLIKKDKNNTESPEELLYHDEYDYSNLTAETEDPIAPGTLLSTIENFELDVNIANIDLNAIYILNITAKAIDPQTNEFIATSEVRKSFNLDIMQANSITQTVTGIPNHLTTNDYLTFQFTPKTNNSNFLNSSIKYMCALYIDGDDTPLKSFPLFPRNLKTTTVNFDKFSAIDKGRGLENLSIGAIRRYRLELYCLDTAIFNINRTELLLDVEKVKDTSGDYVTDGLMLAFDFSADYDNNTREIESLTQPHAGMTPAHHYALELVNARASDLKETGEIDSSDKHLTGNTDDEQCREVATYFVFKNGQGAVLKDLDTNTYVQPTKTFEYQASTSTENTETVTSGYSFEIFYKASFLGDLTETAASLECQLEADQNNTQKYNYIDKTGLILSVGKPTIYLSADPNSVSLRTGKWRHLIVTVEKNADSTLQAKLYINGILSKVSENVKETDLSDAIIAPLALNGIFTGDALINSGTTAVKFMRYYSRPITADEVVQNFKTCYTQKAYLDVIENRNGASSNINVFFVRNRVVPSSDPGSTRQPNSSKIKHYLKFDGDDNLNKITVKEDKDNANTHASKNSAVNCSMIFSYIDSEGALQRDTFYNVDVLLQGTSSLKYPVKNYQIKVYDNTTMGEKSAITPPGTTATEWPTSSYVYTLKCDYMEESHRNNTPTACYYQDRVLDSVINFCKTSACTYYSTTVSNINAGENKADLLFNDATPDGGYSSYSPARRILKINDLDESYRPYRDAIDGVPCILYYNDNDEEAAIDINNIAINTLASNSVCAGSYMFNVDKEGPQLGFELDVKDVSTSYLGDKIKVDSTGKLNYTNDGKLELLTLPCMSFEGATNENLAAATFIPYSEHRLLYLQSIWDTAATIDGTKKKLHLRKVTSKNGSLEYELDSDKTPIMDPNYYIVFSTFGTVEELKAENPPALSISTEEETDAVGGKYKECKSSFISYVLSDYQDKLQNLGNATSFDRALFGCYTLAEYQDVYGKDRYDYIKRTLSPRFDYTDDLDLSTSGYNAKELAYTAIEDAIDWTYDRFKEVESANEAVCEAGKTRFREEFPKFFSFEYCLTYFLQMMLFTQVDNAGKNAMFDTWGNGKFYPRPYDMDTQMGLTNAGYDIIPVTAELNAFFSPQRYAPQILNSMRSIYENPGHSRFTSYNTSNSALWKTFATCFHNEIRACYSYLRDNKIYDVEAIHKYVNSKTRDVIGETFYNQDAFNKYLKNALDLYCVNGSREDRYYEFLNERLTFLDTYYDYLPEGVITGKIRIRTILDKDDSIVLKVLSPMYITVEAEPYKTTCLVTPSDTYTENGIVKSGSKFTFNGYNANDKNVYISGSYNLTAVEGLEDLKKLTEFQIKDVKNLINVIVPGASELTLLEISGSDKLKKIDLASCGSLTSTLTLTDCINLEEVDISNSGVSEINFPEKCNLKSLNCSGNTNLQKLILKNMPNLTNENLRLDGCTALRTLTIENCPGICSTEKVPFLGDSKLADPTQKFLPALSNLTIIDCPNFEFLSLRERQLSGLTLRFPVGGISNLDLYGCMGTAFKPLNLEECKALSTVVLDLVKASSNEEDVCTLKLPLLAEGAEFTKLSLQSSAFSTLYTTTAMSDTFDFSGVRISEPISTAPANLVLQGTKVKNISNLNFTGHLNKLFLGCENLEAIRSCKLTPVLTEIKATSTATSTATTSIEGLFQNCFALREIDNNCEFDFSKVVNASKLCYDCNNLGADSFCYLISKLGDKVTDISAIAEFAFTDVNNFTLASDRVAGRYISFPTSVVNANAAFAWSGIVTVPNNIFKGCDKLEKADSLFYNCSKLRTINNEILVDCTSLTTIQNGFSRCIELTTNLLEPFTITVLDGETSTEKEVSLFAYSNNVQNISHLFSNCSKMTNTEATDLKVFFANLPNIAYAASTFYGCTQLKLTFSTDYIFSHTTASNLVTTAAMFAKSGLNKIPKYLADINGDDLTNYKCARGMFSNIAPTISNIGSEQEIPYTVISSKFFKACPELEYLGDSTTTPTRTNATAYYYDADADLRNTAGIFGNIPNLVISNKAFSGLTSLIDISRALFVGQPDNNHRDFEDSSYIFRSVSTVNDAFYDSTNSLIPNTPVFYRETDTDPFKIENNITDVDVDIFNSVSTLTTLKSVAYLFAGNPNITHLADNFCNKISSVNTLAGMLFGCIKYSALKADTNNFCLLTQNKPNLTNVSYLYKNCFGLNLSMQITKEAGGLFRDSCLDKAADGVNILTTSLNCHSMFYGSNITGNVPVDLFNDQNNSSLRSKLTNTSYMFAKCSRLVGIEQGYATDFNIPYQYDGSEIEYYYFNNHAELVLNYPTYESFKTDIDNYMSSNNYYNRDNWFSTGQQFDRYRSYLEQLFFETRRKYPINLTPEELESIQDITTAELAKVQEGAKELPQGLYYNTDTDQLYNKLDTGMEEVQGASNYNCYLQHDGRIECISSITNFVDTLNSTSAFILGKDSRVNIKTKYGFYNENNKYTVIQPGLLSNCSALKAVDYMFAGCCGLRGSIPADLFASEPGFKYNALSSLNGLFAGCTNLTLRACPKFSSDDSASRLFTDAEIINKYPVPIKDPDQLEMIEQADKRLYLNTGGCYNTVYPVVIYTKTAEGWSRTIFENLNTVDSGKYFIPKDWAASLSKVTSINNLFYNVGIAARPMYNTLLKSVTSIVRAYASTNTDNGNAYYDNQNKLLTDSDKYLYPYLKLDNSIFTGVQLEKAQSAFRGINTLGGTSLNRTFLMSSRTSLKDIQYMFCSTVMQQVTKPFNNFYALEKVKYCLYRLFYNYDDKTGANNWLTSALFEESDSTKGLLKPLSRRVGNTDILNNSEPPEFWNTSSFTNIEATQKKYSLYSLTPEPGIADFFDAEPMGGNTGWGVFSYNSI
jgi:hypothetical protein